MPGIAYHEMFANQVYTLLCNKTTIDHDLFMMGNQIPDLGSDKDSTHFKVPASVKGFFVPNLSAAYEAVFDPNNSLLLGIFSHLYLDYYFIEDILLPSFIWDTEKKKITNPSNRKVWTPKTFFSKNDGLYGCYTSINHLLIRDGYIDVDEMMRRPDFLPLCSIDYFDVRRAKTWKEEFCSFLEDKREYTGDCLNYEFLCEQIKLIADAFVKTYF